MTLAELASRLGLRSVSGLRTQIHRGVLEGIRVGTGQHAIWLITESEAKRYEEEHHGKHGFAAESHPFHGKRPPRKQVDE